MSTTRYSTVVAKKVVMAITGLAMCVFLVGHLLGNLQLLWSKAQFNGYAHFLTAQPVVVLVELGLMAIFILHIVDALVLLKNNQDARPVGYYKQVWAREKSDKSRKSVSSTFMMWSGIAILLFVIFHVWHFKYHHALTQAGRDVGSQMGGPSATLADYDLGLLVTSEFHNPFVCGIYVLAMILLGLHLYHAVSSALTSLGANHPRYAWAVVWLGRIFTIVVCGGFAFLPIAAHFGIFGVGK